ncbi:MAG: glycosyltransferase [Opitutaceae bacterium]|nr:glycosyltransferase [Opitutaceae bacterium]
MTSILLSGIFSNSTNACLVAALREKLGISQDTIILGTIARLDPIKNHSMMLEAFALVLKEHANTVLIIVGDGEERNNIESKIKQLGLKGQVILPGYEPQPQHYLALMDIFLLSSLSEGTSMTLLEAMALGKPCVATDAGGNPEIVTDQLSGYVTKNDDFKDFAEKILLLTTMPKTRESLSVEAKSIFHSKFSDQKMVMSYQQICKQLTEIGS